MHGQLSGFPDELQDWTGLSSV